jgi:DNA-binding NarL/FixJ family response regulator
MKPITVLLAEDHNVVREGMRSLLQLQIGIDIVGEATNGREAVEMALKLQPAVVLMDIAMPELNGFEATRQILKALPATRVLILSAYSDDAYVDGAIARGAAGYLIKHTSAQSLVHAIREVAGGKPFFSTGVARRLATRQRRLPDHAGQLQKPRAALTHREAEVLQLIAEGNANKQIADTLRISIKTVEKHRQQLMGKLDIHEIAGLTRYAIAAGIIEGGLQIKIV